MRLEDRFKSIATSMREHRLGFQKIHRKKLITELSIPFRDKIAIEVVRFLQNFIVIQKIFSSRL